MVPVLQLDDVGPPPQAQARLDTAKRELENRLIWERTREAALAAWNANK